jgi:hypothetical protein
MPSPGRFPEPERVPSKGLPSEIVMPAKAACRMPPPSMVIGGDGVGHAGGSHHQVPSKIRLASFISPGSNDGLIAFSGRSTTGKAASIASRTADALATEATRTEVSDIARTFMAKIRRSRVMRVPHGPGLNPKQTGRRAPSWKAMVLPPLWAVSVRVTAAAVPARWRLSCWCCLRPWPSST